MKHHTQLQAKLGALLEDRALPFSNCGRGFLRFVTPLIDAGVLTWVRSGAGRRLAVVDAGALAAFSTQSFPETASPANSANRIKAVARFRDTKALPNDTGEVVSIRVWLDEALLKHGQGVGAAAATAQHGLFSFPLTSSSPFSLHGRCAMVENPAVFHAVEQLQLDVGAVIYGRGRISTRALNWLALANAPEFRLLHLPDYDPVGLSEFQRLYSRLGNRAELYLPEDLEELFAKYSNPQLLNNRSSRAVLAKLRRTEVPAVKQIVSLIDRYNGGLEQEALLVTPNHLAKSGRG
jgi:hypothetical protein